MSTFEDLFNRINSEVIQHNLLTKFSGDVDAAEFAVMLDALLEGYFEKMSEEVKAEQLEKLEELKGIMESSFGKMMSSLDVVINSNKTDDGHANESGNEIC